MNQFGAESLGCNILPTALPARLCASVVAGSPSIAAKRQIINGIVLRSIIFLLSPSIQPDIVLVDSQWPRRALLRAQLIEEGYEVVAVDDWPSAKSYVDALPRPRLVIVDLQGMTNASVMLDELHTLMAPDRVLMLTALAGVPKEYLEDRRFHVIARPAEVRDIVKKVFELLGGARRRPPL